MEVDGLVVVGMVSVDGGGAVDHEVVDIDPGDGRLEKRGRRGSETHTGVLAWPGAPGGAVLALTGWERCCD